MARRLLAVTALVMAACATAPVPRDVQRMAIVEGADFDRTWDAVIEILGERTWAIDNVERASGLITTDWMLTGDASDEYMDCGSASFLSTHRDHEVRFNVLVRDGDVGAELTVNSTMRATSWNTVDGTPIGATQCFSTGALEREIHDEVLRRVLGRS